jgi:hypothetical protein
MQDVFTLGSFSRQFHIYRIFTGNFNYIKEANGTVLLAHQA